ncbi:MAG: KH domain-containing protein [Chloroflexota bacterium]
MKSFVEFVVKGLVDNPDQVSVEEVADDDGGSILELTVAPNDMGRIIGKSGRVINAVRSLLQVAATKQGQQVSLELIETGESR